MGAPRQVRALGWAASVRTRGTSRAPNRLHRAPDGRRATTGPPMGGGGLISFRVGRNVETEEADVGRAESSDWLQWQVARRARMPEAGKWRRSQEPGKLGWWVDAPGCSGQATREKEETRQMGRDRAGERALGKLGARDNSKQATDLLMRAGHHRSIRVN